MKLFEKGLDALLLIIGIAAIVLCIHFRQQSSRLRSDVNRLNLELAHAQIPLKRDTIRDSIEVVTQTVVEVVPRKLTDALAADQQLIKELQLRVKQLESMQTTVIETSDTVAAKHDTADSLFYYSDQWADLKLSLRDTTFYYNIRDSLSTLVYREYRHRFLWWRWGTKGYRLKIVNFNPHSKVSYNKYIKADK